MSDKEEVKTNKFVFVYSVPLEETFLSISNKKQTKNYYRKLFILANEIQYIWNSYEERVLELFEEIYRLKIPRNKEYIFVSKATPNSISFPLVIGIRNFYNFDKRKEGRVRLILNIIHELAHYFSIDSKKNGYIDDLFLNISNQKPGLSQGIVVHYLIQSVEFGIGGELFGKELVAQLRENVSQIKNQENEYAISAKMLIENGVPLSRNCLEHIEQQVA